MEPAANKADLRKAIKQIFWLFAKKDPWLISLYVLSQVSYYGMLVLSAGMAVAVGASMYNNGLSAWLGLAFGIWGYAVGMAGTRWTADFWGRILERALEKSMLDAVRKADEKEGK